MAESSPNPPAVDTHVECPYCAYDLFGSAGSCCPECGLPATEELLAEYQAGRRPARLEMPHRPILRSLLQLDFIWVLRPHLARGFPPDAAKRFGYQVRALGIAVFTVLNAVNLAFVVANKGDLLIKPGRTVIAPSSSVLMLLPLFAILSCAAAMLSYLSIRWSFRRRLKRAGLSTGDAERVVAFTAIQQIPVSIGIQVSYPLSFFCGDSDVGLMIAAPIFLLGAYASYKPVQFFVSEFQRTQLSRSPRSIAAGCVDSIARIWIFAWLLTAVVTNKILEILAKG